MKPKLVAILSVGGDNQLPMSRRAQNGLNRSSKELVKTFTDVEPDIVCAANPSQYDAAVAISTTLNIPRFHQEISYCPPGVSDEEGHVGIIVAHMSIHECPLILILPDIWANMVAHKYSSEIKGSLRGWPVIEEGRGIIFEDAWHRDL